MSFSLVKFTEQSNTETRSLTTQLGQYFAMNPEVSIAQAVVSYKDSPGFGIGFTQTFIVQDVGTRHYATEFISDATSSADTKAVAFFAANPTFFPVLISDLTSSERRYLSRQRLQVVYVTNIPAINFSWTSRAFAALAVFDDGDGNRLKPDLTAYDVILLENLGNLAWPAGGRAVAIRNEPSLGGTASAGFAGIGPSGYAGPAPAPTTTTTTITVDPACLLNPFETSTTVTPPPNTTTSTSTTSTSTSTSSTSTSSTSTSSTSSTSTTTTITCPPTDCSCGFADSLFSSYGEAPFIGFTPADESGICYWNWFAEFDGGLSAQSWVLSYNIATMIFSLTGIIVRTLNNVVPGPPDCTAIYETGPIAVTCIMGAVKLCETGFSAPLISCDNCVVACPTAEPYVF